MKKWALHDIAWAAGVFEGEGHIELGGSSPIRVSVLMTDGDVVKKLHSLTGMGTLRGPYTRKLRGVEWKPAYVWRISKNADARRFLKAIYPFMGSRRAERIEEALGIGAP